MTNNKETMISWINRTIETLQQSLRNIAGEQSSGKIGEKEATEKRELCLGTISALKQRINEINDSKPLKPIKRDTNCFIKEIKEIKSTEVQNFVKEFLSTFVDPQFYEVPSSSTGKYHPIDETVQGGLVLHTKRVVKIATELASLRHNEITADDRDYLIAAAILHDTCKSGSKGNWGTHTEFTHPLIAGSLACSFTKYLVIGMQVGSIIMTHMGQWNTSQYQKDVVLPLPSDRLHQILFEADYLASRAYIKIDI